MGGGGEVGVAKSGTQKSNFHDEKIVIFSAKLGVRGSSFFFKLRGLFSGPPPCSI